MSLVVLPKDARRVPGTDGYWASPDGRIFSEWKPHAGGVPRKLECGMVNQLPGTVANHGYRMVGIGSRSDGSYRNRQVHIIILETFVGPCPDGMETLHRDGNPLNNSLSNLAWGTPAENAADTFRHGRKRRCVLTEEQWAAVVALRRSGESVHSIAKRFGVTNMTIHGGLKQRLPVPDLNKTGGGG